MSKIIPHENEDDSHDPIQRATEECADEIINILGNNTPPPAFLAVHFVCGNVGEGNVGQPGFIRKSAVRLGESFLNRLNLPTEIKGAINPEEHRRVLRRHVQLFERDRTLLRRALAERDSVEPPGKFWYRVGKAAPEKLPAGWTSGSLEWPDEIGRFLVPSEKAESYFKLAYVGGTLSSEILTDFEMQRAEAFARWIQAGPANNENRKNVWDDLHPLQSSLIYFTVAADADSRDVCGDFLVFPLERITTSSGTLLEPLAVVVISPAKQDNNVCARLEAAVYGKLGADPVRSHLNGDKDLTKGQGSMLECLSISNDAKGKIMEASRILPIPGHQDRFQFLTLWFALLIEKLKNSVHEKKPLEFWFVAGDRSEFEDDKDVLFDKRFTEKKDIQIFSPYVGDDVEKSKQQAELAAKILEREHFPWFEDGRYALFFDLTSRQMSVIGLCGIRRSTWSHLFSEVYKSAKEQEREKDIRIPMSLIGFVAARHGGGGIGVCHPQATTGKKLRYFLRLRDKEWRSATDERHEKLIELFKGAATKATQEQCQSLAELCVLIADNPHAGGTVVLLNDNADVRKFTQMGKPWDFGRELSPSEKALLMAHDGATLVKFGDDPKFDYRFMLTPEGVSETVREKLAKLSANYLKRSPLAGVGTRRWSAALSAFRENVETVIVISQDGDITCWQAPNKDDCESAMIKSLPLGKIPEEHNFRFYLHD